MDDNEIFQLGELMCFVTRDSLWQPAEQWVRARSPGSSLHCRVGSGQATYHRFDPRDKQHQITYGVRMIAAKHQRESASGWLSGREIQRRGYFGGELSTLNLLAHTCCHEFAHLLQHSAGQRFRGSVHNRHFYKILDELHQSGAADATRDALADQARQKGLALPDACFEPVDTRQQLARWQVGDTVRFGAGQRELEGQIIRVNRKTCTVDGIGHSRGVRYRVPVQMLNRLTPSR
ncbi:hypothetical protein [Marinobacter sp.]|uniref:hypothetical protein n=1 Tax=Marinobacter sp. TaxID=50741 RepID=UPI003A8FFDDA